MPHGMCTPSAQRRELLAVWCGGQRWGEASETRVEPREVVGGALGDEVHPGRVEMPEPKCRDRRGNTGPAEGTGVGRMEVRGQVVGDGARRGRGGAGRLQGMCLSGARPLLYPQSHSQLLGRQLAQREGSVRNT